MSGKDEPSERVKLIIPLLFFITVFQIHAIGFGSSLHTQKTLPDSIGNSKERKAQNEALPFDLKKAELPKIEISYLFHSQKFGAGFQEIIISGNGTLRLKKTLSYSDKPEIVEGKIGENELLVLLKLIADEDFINLENSYPTEGGTTGYRKLSLKLPSRIKEVMIYEGNCSAFDVVAGDVKAMAGTSLPQALGNKFFPVIW